MRLLPLFFATVLAAPPADEVTSLPGWSGALPSKVYSGYVNVSATAGMPMMVHYLYMESEQAPATDPTIMWSNGGPGASSMFGLLVELGPYLLNDDSIKTDEYKKTGVPTLFPNKFSWSKLGSILMFDWPPPVGFSYCGDPRGKGNSCGAWDDSLVAAANAEFLGNWQAAFPKFARNELFITGESLFALLGTIGLVFTTADRMEQQLTDGDQW